MPFFIFVLVPAVVEAVQITVGAAAVATAAVSAVHATARTIDRVSEWQRQTATTTTYVERKTLWDWWGNGLRGWERDILLEHGYSDKEIHYNLQELKFAARNKEKELLPDESQRYIQEYVSMNNYNSSSSDDDRVVKRRKKNCSKSESPVWRGLKNFRGSLKCNGRPGRKARYYQWDYEKNNIEVYNHLGDHLGSMDPIKGTIYEEPISGRNIRHLLR